MLCFNHSNKDSFSFSENLFTEMSMFDAAFSRYLRLISGFDLAYISVVITVECPKKSRIYMRLTPLSRRCIAFECRSKSKLLDLLRNHIFYEIQTFRRITLNHAIRRRLKFGFYFIFLIHKNPLMSHLFFSISSKLCKRKIFRRSDTVAI